MTDSRDDLATFDPPLMERTRRAPRPTFMEPTRFAAFGERLFGHGWQRTLADQLGYNRVQINRYAVGAEPIPISVAYAMWWMIHQLDSGHAPQPVQPVGDILHGVYTARATPRPLKLRP